MSTHKFIIVNTETKEEIVVNQGLTLKYIDSNGGIHNFGWEMAVGYFFEFVTEAHENSNPLKELYPAWGKGDIMSLEETQKRKKIALEKLLNDPNNSLIKQKMDKLNKTK